MSTTALLVLLSLLIVGVLLIALGRRGRRQNDHPQCRWCGFDLMGVYPASPTCPECGAGLKRPGAVRDGVRHRSIPLIVLGVLLAATPLLPLGVVGYAAVTGTNISKYLPVGVLIFQARHSSPATSPLIAAELMDRTMGKKLTVQQEQKVAGLVLELQADESKPWSEKWGDLFGRINLNGNVTADQLTAYGNHAPVLVFASRAVVRAGDPLAIRVEAGGVRVGASDTFRSEVTCISVTLNDTELKARGFDLPGDGLPRDPDNFIGMMGSSTLNLSGSKGQRIQGGRNQLVVSRRVPRNFETGKATATVTLTVRSAPGRGGGWQQRPEKDPSARRVTLKVPVTITPADGPGVELLTPTPEQETKMRTALTEGSASETVQFQLSDTFWGNDDHGRGLGVMVREVDPATLPLPACFDVLVKYDGKEHPLGRVMTGGGVDGWVREHTQNGWSASGITVYVMPTDKRCDLIYRPRPSLARYTTDLTQIYGAEVVFKDIPLRIRDERRDRKIPLDKVQLKPPKDWREEEE